MLIDGTLRPVNPKQSFAAAADTFVQLVSQVREDQLDSPGLGIWDLRSLIGHASRALLTVDSYLDQPAETEQVHSPATYFLVALRPGARTDPAAVAERGQQAGAALGDDPAETVRRLRDRVVSRVETVNNPLIQTGVGGMWLKNYLPTRTFELVVHSLDVADAAGLEPPHFPDEITEGVATLAARIAVARGHGSTVILALTGRSSLPDDFSVV